MKLVVYEYWSEPPPEPSPKLAKWIEKICSGWKPNRRISVMSYEEASEFYDVYIWEYFNVIQPLIKEMESKKINADSNETNSNNRSES